MDADTDIKEFLLDIILNYTDEGIASIDTRGIVTYYNERMSDIEGLNQEEVIGKYILDIYPTFNLKNSTMLETLRVGKPIFNVEQRYSNNNGKEIFCLVTDIPIIKDGKVEGVVELVKDIDTIKNLYHLTNHFKKKEHNTKDSLNRKSKLNYYNFDDFKTQNKELISLIGKIKELSDTNLNVLIYGETGTGKEIIAQSIHNMNNIKDKPFIAQNCAAIPENLLESILFGTTKGSFTGAVDRIGLFEQADGGTLLLDELNSMPMYLQPKLLRVLEEGCITRIGSYIERKVDVKVISTVNVEPILLIEQKKLREDLFYRLCRISVYIPPLRKRKEDILFLTNHFINEHNLISNKSVTLSMEVKEIFNRYNWDGNVRELKNIIDSAFDVLKNGKEMKIEHLSCYFVEKLKKQNIIKEDIEENNLCDDKYLYLLQSFEKNLITGALKQTNGNVSEASKRLGIKRSTLQHKIKRLMIEY